MKQEENSVSLLAHILASRDIFLSGSHPEVYGPSVVQ